MTRESKFGTHIIFEEEQKAVAKRAENRGKRFVAGSDEVMEMHKLANNRVMREYLLQQLAGREMTEKDRKNIETIAEFYSNPIYIDSGFEWPLSFEDQQTATLVQQAIDAASRRIENYHWDSQDVTTTLKDGSLILKVKSKK